jgi:hypothetical protein
MGQRGADVNGYGADSKPLVIGDGGVIVQGPSDLMGLSPDKVLQYAKALDRLARRSTIRAEVLEICYRRGWVDGAGDLTDAGERFRDYWRNRKFVRRHG